MNLLLKSMVVPALFIAVPFVMADSAKDCLLEGTVLHGEQAGQGTTSVQINSISKYDAQSRCNVKRNQKMEFKLPPDTRLQEAPAGSGVKYRYRTDEKGQSETQLISVGA